MAVTPPAVSIMSLFGIQRSSLLLWLRAAHLATRAVPVTGGSVSAELLLLLPTGSRLPHKSQSKGLILLGFRFSIVPRLLLRRGEALQRGMARRTPRWFAAGPAVLSRVSDEDA